MLQSAEWTNACGTSLSPLFSPHHSLTHTELVLDSHYAQPFCARCHVYVRLPPLVGLTVRSLTTNNLDVDYYYYGTAGGRRFWWKQHVTTLQISQFIIDLCIVYYASFQLFSHRAFALPISHSISLPVERISDPSRLFR